MLYAICKIPDRAVGGMDVLQVMLYCTVMVQDRAHTLRYLHGC